MLTQKRIFLLLCCCAFTGFIFGQKLIFESSAELKTTYPISKIIKAVAYRDGSLLLANTRVDGDLDGLLIYLDSTGNILKVIKVGKADRFDRMVNISKKENGYYLLLNSAGRDGTAKLLLYQLDDNLSILNDKELPIAGMSSASAFVYNPKENSLEIVVSVTDKSDNTFPRLVHYDLKNETQSSLNFNRRSRPENLENPWYKTVYKECTNIQFTDDRYQELILTGQENSSTVADFWVAKVVNGLLVWENRFPSELGGDEGITTFNFDDKFYLTFGHEYSKGKDSYYSYRIVQSDMNGQQLSTQQFNTDKKEWLKDVARIGKNHFLMFGQRQSVSLPGPAWEDDEVVESSDLWMVLVDDQGVLVSEYLHETDSLDEALVVTELASGRLLVFYLSGEVWKTGRVIVDN